MEIHVGRIWVSLAVLVVVIVVWSYMILYITSMKVMSSRKKSLPIKKVTLTVDPDDYVAIDKCAHKSDVSASWIIRRSIREFLERHCSEIQLEVPLTREAHR